MPIHQRFSSHDALNSDDLYAYIVVSVAIVFSLTASGILHLSSRNCGEAKRKHWAAFVLRYISLLIIYFIVIHGLVQFLNRIELDDHVGVVWRRRWRDLIPVIRANDATGLAVSGTVRGERR
jgi:hypothetical protein